MMMMMMKTAEWTSWVTKCLWATECPDCGILEKSGVSHCRKADGNWWRFRCLFCEAINGRDQFWSHFHWNTLKTRVHWKKGEKIFPVARLHYQIFRLFWGDHLPPTDTVRYLTPTAFCRYANYFMASGSLRCMMAVSFRHMKGNFPNSILSDIKSQHSRNSGCLFMPHVHCSLDKGKTFCTAMFEQHALNLPECSCVIKMLTVVESTKCHTQCGAFQKNNYSEFQTLLLKSWLPLYKNSQTAMELARTLNRITCCGTTTNTFVIHIEILFSKATSNCTLIQRRPSTGNFNVRKNSQTIFEETFSEGTKLGTNAK